MLIATSAAFGGLACRNQCDFFERCNGHVREVCGGVDQMIGRKIESYPCTGANPVCVSLDEYHARCVFEPATRCDDGYDPRCEGDLLLACMESIYINPGPADRRFVVATDCTELADPSLPGHAPGVEAHCLSDDTGVVCVY